MARQPKKGLGALAPPGMEWQIGKTAASIRFVQDAEAAIEGGEFEPFENAALQAEIDAIKRGDHALSDWLSVDEFLATRHD